MKFTTGWHEGHWHTSEPLKTSNWSAQLGKLWTRLIDALSTSSEPSVELVRDWLGHSHWRAYDPVTSQTFYCDSEEEVRIWLEDRYHIHRV